MATFNIVIIGLIILPFLLFFIRIFIICWQNYTLARQLKILEQQAACQQTAAPNTTTNNDNNTNNNGDDMTPKGFDLPPAYDDVVQSYMMAKQNQEREQTQESNVNEGATGGIAANPSTNSISTAVSTLTIETEISNSNHNSIVDLEQATTSTIPNPKSLQQPPSYDHSIEMSAVKNKNDHIV